MKITDVEAIHINPKLCARNANQKPRFSGIDTQTIYKVTLNNGVVGWGDTRGHVTLSDTAVSALVGTSPMPHLHNDHSTGLHGALYDAVGKSLEVPAWQLMGRKYRDRVPVAAWTRPASPEDLAAEVQRAVGEGYMTFKSHSCAYYCVVEQTQAVQDVAPAGFRFHWDFNHNRTPTDIMRLVAEIETAIAVVEAEAPEPVAIVSHRPAPDFPLPLPTAAAAPVALAVSQRVTIMDLRDSMCRWPLGDPTTPDFRFCGARSITGLPYCTHHAEIAYQPAAERKRDRRAASFR